MSKPDFGKPDVDITVRVVSVGEISPFKSS